MNKNLYRLVFNQQRGQLMAVAETAASQDQAQGEGTGSSAPRVHPVAATALSMTLAAAAFAVMVLCHGAHAQIRADAGAPKHQQPVILGTANGVPLVNIQAPSAAGVSRNSYSQFDVQAAGAILNNSRTDVQTQIGGWVQANPQLARGGARVILNEVNSSQASQLKGYVEVAGQRAEVIIANPAGIQVDGGGFINASGVTLTTGTPVVTGGTLESYRVQGGQVRIDGAGLDTSSADYSAILARAVQVNAGIWANDLRVVTGANQIGAGQTGLVNALPGSGTGFAPVVSLDVAALGGMYAGKITLIGTEAGLGVRNAGTLSASSGALVLDANGWLSNSGTLQAQGALRLTAAGDLTNTGTVYAGGDAELLAGGSISNRAGALIAARGSLALQASGPGTSDGQIDSEAGAVLAAGLNADGSTAAGGRPSDVRIDAAQAAIIHGQAMATGELSIAGSYVDLQGAELGAGSARLVARTGDVQLHGARASVSGLLAVQTPGTLTTDGARIVAGQLQFTAHDLYNRGGELMQTGAGDISIDLPGLLDNTSGRIAVNSANLSITADTLNNTDGRLEHAGSGLASLKAQALTNTGGLIGSNGALEVTAQDLTNARGQLQAAKDTALTVAALNNAQGSVSAGRDLRITGDAVSGDGQLLAGRDASVLVNGDFSNTGTVQAGRDLTIEAVDIVNQASAASGGLAAGGLLTTRSASLTNHGTIVGGELSVNASERIVNSGPGALLGATDEAGTLELLAPDIQNRDDVTTTDAAPSTLILGLGRVVLAGGRDANGQYTAAERVLNQSAVIESGGDMQITADLLTNTRRVLTAGTTYTNTGTSTRTAVWTAANPDVPGGRYIEPPHGGGRNSDYLYTAYTATTARNDVEAISPEAQILAGGDFTPTVGTLQNYWSKVSAGGDIALNGVALDQDSWRGAQTLTERTTSAGTYVYRSYRGEIWTNPWGPEVLHAAVPTYESSFTANGALAGSGNTMGNGSTLSLPGTYADAATGSPSGPLNLPAGGLYNTNPAADSLYLVETNPAFVNRRQWQGSDYYLSQLGLDPSKLQKRLGDSYYEQQLVRDQVLALTGRTVADGYATAQAQFEAMYAAGAALAKSLALHPGLGLTAAQVAALTSDVILLEEREVQVPVNGVMTLQKVLVPIVYLAHVKPGDLQANGALIAAADIDLTATRSLSNPGSMVASGRFNLGMAPGAVLDSRGGTLTAGGAMTLSTANSTIDLTSASVKAGQLQITSGADLLLGTASSERTSVGNHPGSQQTRTQTDLGRTGRIEVTGDAAIQTAGDFRQAGADLTVGGNLQADIGGSYVLGTVARTDHTDASFNKGGASGESNSTVVQHQTSSVTVGGQSRITAGQDFTARGAAIDLQGGGSIAAGRNIDLGAASNTLDTQSTGRHKSSGGRSGNDARQAHDETLIGTSVTSGADLTLRAGSDLTVSASQVSADGHLAIAAGGNVNITSAEEAHSSSFEQRGGRKGMVSSKSSVERGSQDTRLAVGSDVTAKSITVVSGQDIHVQGSNVSAAQDVNLIAGRDVDISSAQSQSRQTSFAQEKRSGLSASLTGGISYGKSAQDQSQSVQQTVQVGSLVSGANVNIASGRDTTVAASAVVADHDVTVVAGRDIAVLSATDTTTQQSDAHSKSTSIGLAPGLSGRFTAFGKTSAAQDGDGTTNTAVTSLISANDGNLTMRAGAGDAQLGTGQGTITTQGADLLAGDRLSLSANAIDLQASQSSSTSRFHAESKSVTLGSQLTGVIGGQITRIGDLIEQARTTDNSRLAGASALKAGYDAYKSGIPSGEEVDVINAHADKTAVLNGGAAGQGDPASGAFGISISLGTSKSRQDERQASATQRGTSLQGGSIDITAREGDISGVGTYMQARDIALDAAGDLDFKAAKNTAEVRSSNSASSSGVGVTVGLGSQNGISFQAGASNAKGRGKGSETTYSNSQIIASNSLATKSGGDTTLSGAQLAGDTVKMDVGKDLTIQSLQDSSRYDSKQTNAGFGVSLCVPPLCYGTPVTGSVAAGKETVNHDYLSVTQQSGIAAGSGGFDISVKGNTDLKGAAITSTASQDKNSLTTGSLTFSDLQNHQITRSESESASFGYGGGSLVSTLANNLTSNVLGNALGGAALPEDQTQTSQTLSVISPAKVTITGEDSKSQLNADTLTTRDAATANGSLTNSLTLQQAQELHAQQQKAKEDAQAAQLLGAVMDSVIGDLGVKYQWAEGSPEKTALHGLSGLIQASAAGTNGLAGLAAGAANELLLPSMEKLLVDLGYAKGTAEFNSLLTAGSTLVGAAVGSATGNAGTGASVALIGTTHNYLKHTEIEQKRARLAACETQACKDSVDNEYLALSEKNDSERIEACLSGTKSQCEAKLKESENDWIGLQKDLALLNTKWSGATSATEKETIGSQINDAQHNLNDWNSLRVDELFVKQQRFGLTDDEQTELVRRMAASSGLALAGMGGALPGGGKLGSGKSSNHASDVIPGKVKVGPESVNSTWAKGGAAVVDGLAFRADLTIHIIGPDGFTKSGQLSGTHNLANAMSALDTKGAAYTLNPTGTAGVYELPYAYTNPATGKLVSGSKTVYDPAVFSDQTMINNAQQAGQQAWAQYLQNPTVKVIDGSVGGVNFRSYINVDKNGNAFIGNVHPIK
ncbi:MAG: hemagglutinin repeat-containing protein [Polaromonas sp.]|nr:hemagglutinin repeat-containing protein [Polaromonas sp.]